MFIVEKHPTPNPDPEFVNLVLDYRQAAEDFNRLFRAVANGPPAARQAFDLTTLQAQLDETANALRELAQRPSKPAPGIPVPSLN